MVVLQLTRESTMYFRWFFSEVLSWVVNHYRAENDSQRNHRRLQGQGQQSPTFWSQVRNYTKGELLINGTNSSAAPSYARWR